VDPNITNQDGYTALMWAAVKRHASVVMVVYRGSPILQVTD